MVCYGISGVVNYSTTLNWSICILFTRDHTLWLVSKVHLITILTRQQSVVSEGRWGLRVA